MFQKSPKYLLQSKELMMHDGFKSAKFLHFFKDIKNYCNLGWSAKCLQDSFKVAKYNLQFFQVRAGEVFESCSNCILLPSVLQMKISPNSQSIIAKQPTSFLNNSKTLVLIIKIISSFSCRILQSNSKWSLIVARILSVICKSILQIFTTCYRLELFCNVFDLSSWTFYLREYFFFFCTLTSYEGLSIAKILSKTFGKSARSIKIIIIQGRSILQ